MIGKPEWFKIRRFGGWGITPDTWQGWLYLALVIFPFVIIQALPFWSEEVRRLITTVWTVFLLVDVTDIMIRLRKDEREKIEEAVAERNAAWAMVVVLISFLLYRIISAAIKNQVDVDWTAAAALGAGALVKTWTHIKFRKR